MIRSQDRDGALTPTRNNEAKSYIDTYEEQDSRLSSPLAGWQQTDLAAALAAEKDMGLAGPALEEVVAEAAEVEEVEEELEVGMGMGLTFWKVIRTGLADAG